MLITLPDFDITTKYLSAWSKEIINIAERNGIKPIVINSEKVNLSHVTKNIKTKG